MKQFRIIFLLTILLSSISISAENGINSPYTRFGFGQLGNMETGINKSMGGVGISLRNGNQINIMNPASYSSVDTLTFLMDIGASLQNTNFSENGVRMNAHNASFDYLAFQIRLIPHLGLTFGCMPFSNIGYDFSNSTIISNHTEGEDGIVSTNRYYGEGGLRQVVVGLGWEPFKGFSVGANISYLYGELYHFIYNQYNDPSVSPLTKQYKADISTYKADFGLQYQVNFGKHSMALGATYQLGHKIPNKSYTLITSGNNSGLSTDTLASTPFSLPHGFGAGVSYKYDERLTVAIDYTLQMYGKTKFFGYSGNDYHRLSLGVEFIPKRISRNIFERSRYRAGLYAATSHYMVNEQKGPNEFGFSIGIGLPIMNMYNNKTIVNISGQAAHVRPQVPGMITENYLRLNIGISINEHWFDKWKVQ